MKKLPIHALKIFSIFIVVSIAVVYVGEPDLRTDYKALLIKGLEFSTIYTIVFSFLKWREIKKKESNQTDLNK